MNNDTDIQILIRDLEIVSEAICNFLNKHLETERFFKVNATLLYTKASILREIMCLLSASKTEIKESKK